MNFSHKYDDVVWVDHGFYGSGKAVVTSYSTELDGKIVYWVTSLNNGQSFLVSDDDIKKGENNVKK